MVLRWFALVVVAALCSSGCLKSGDGDRVNRLLAEQKEHARQISQISKKIDTVDEKLGGIEKSINALVGAASRTTSAKGQELVVASDFASTKEYQDIMQLMGVLQEQVAMVQGDFAGFQDNQRVAREREALRDRGAAFQSLGQPGEMSRRLDILVKNFSGNIADAATRSQFVQDVETVKASLFVSLSPQEKLQRARALLSETINAASNDRLRGMLERQLRSLDEAQGGEEQGERADRVVQYQKLREIASLAREYNIPGDVVRDSGLISWTAPHPPMFSPRGDR